MNDPALRVSEMRTFLGDLMEGRMRSYAADPGLLREQYGEEQTVLAGGYGYRQILELVQNGADAILESYEQGAPHEGGDRIHVLLRGARLYVANTGAPLSKPGVDALLRSHSSPKRSNQIGRFGLGFKSLLRLEDCIDVFTRNAGALRFDPERCQRELKQQFGVKDAPGLRLAWPLDEDERSTDDVLAELGWAETIVRIGIRSDDTIEHLRQEIREFPAEFLLFFPVSATLALEDGTTPSRELRVEPDAGQLVLRDGAESSRWHVASCEVRITDERALADATRIHARETVPLAWAMPLEGKREEAGRFWAFFPTRTASYIPGILNAPWKLNSDRNAIIGGAWNTALMLEAARLIADTLPILSTPTDPARPLDAFPRQLERRDDDAAPLVEALWRALERSPTIPDATGLLREARVLWRHPRDSIDLANRWQAIAESISPTQFVHPTCLERQRNSRLNALADRLSSAPNDSSSAGLRRAETASWFAAVASTDAARAKAVLELAEAYSNDCKPAEWSTVRPQLAIVPSESGVLLKASQVLLAPADTSVPGRAPVASALYGDAEATRILSDIMGVQAPDDNVWDQVLNSLLAAVRANWQHPNPWWVQFWEGLRKAPSSARSRMLLKHAEEMRVRRRDDEWVWLDQALLPGELVSADDLSVNTRCLVDNDFHSADGDELHILGVTGAPQGDVRFATYRAIDRDTEVLDEWLEECRERYKQVYQNSASWGYLRVNYLTMPKGYDLLAMLVGGANARLTDQYSQRIGNGEFRAKVLFGHSTMTKYPIMSVSHPLLWFVLRHGLVEIGEHCIRLAAMWCRREEPAVAILPWWVVRRKAFEGFEGAFPTVSTSVLDIWEMWFALFDVLVTPASVANDAHSELWAAAARDDVIPMKLPQWGGFVGIDTVFVTGSSDLARLARSPERIVVSLDDATREKWIGAGARDLSGVITPEWSEALSPEVLLISVIPELALVLREDARETARAQLVSGLTLSIDGASEPVPCLMWERTLLLDEKQLDRHSRAARLRLLLTEIAPTRWLAGTLSEALRTLVNERVAELRALVAQRLTLAERLLGAVGDRREPLLEALGAVGAMDFVRECSSLQLAELTLAQLGPAALRRLKGTLEVEGLDPPGRWGTSEARTFVASIGFPVEYSVAPQAKRDDEETISGPINLPPLHDFQKVVLQGLRELIHSSGHRRRAVVSLPTGGGKTRVTVEAAVSLVLAPEGQQRSVVWVAQTDELCEQAVQAFRQVWLNLGAQRTDLRIVRLWGGNANPAIQQLDRPIVVIASIATLNSRIGVDALTWLRKPGLVVVDECHHAIAPSYTNMLRWLDAEASRVGAAKKDEPPIIGLSATPFRTDDDESQRLAKRFGNQWLPSDQEALHSRLLSQGVLAHATYEALHSASSLDAAELLRLAKIPEPWEGLDFDNLLTAINLRLAGDSKRNEQIVDHISRYDEQSILFFANSVEHAEEISARLHFAGVPAAAISADTPTSARRHFLDRFLSGEIRVLCNHSVLTTGFDAPRTDMVFIARQVFSPVRYMQMVGRGLRGEENGGTKHCRIVTVMDNLGRFEERHPYHYCRQYFT